MSDREPNQESEPEHFSFGDVVEIGIEDNNPFNAVVIGKSGIEIVTANIITDSKHTKIGTAGSQPAHKLRHTKEEPWDLDRIINASITNYAEFISDEASLNALVQSLREELEQSRRSFEDPSVDS